MASYLSKESNDVSLYLAINRTLKRLRKEDKIRPNGTGRSASWIRIVDYERFDVPNMQLDLFQIMSDITPNKADE